jgi:hypothetical protein
VVERRLKLGHCPRPEPAARCLRPQTVVQHARSRWCPGYSLASGPNSGTSRPDARVQDGTRHQPGSAHAATTPAGASQSGAASPRLCSCCRRSSPTRPRRRCDRPPIWREAVDHEVEAGQLIELAGKNRGPLSAGGGIGGGHPLGPASVNAPHEYEASERKMLAQVVRAEASQEDLTASDRPADDLIASASAAATSSSEAGSYGVTSNMRGRYRTSWNEARTPK